MGFEKCHPMINFIYFTIVLYGMVFFRHPIYLAISLCCAFAYSIKRNGVKAIVFAFLLLPCVIAFALYYSSYTHFGITVLEENLIGNNITLESLVYGLVLGCIVAGCMIWFSCIYSVFSSDKMVYLFGRISPRLSLFLAILLRLVPRVKQEARRIHTAQKGIGRGINQGNVFQRMRNGICILSILITWMIESLTLASESMQSRGSLLRGRTAFSIYRFDYRDRLYVIGMFFFLTIVMMGQLLNQSNIIFDPRIIMPPVTAWSYLFYIGYAAFCLMPLGLELWTEYSVSRIKHLFWLFSLP